MISLWQKKNSHFRALENTLSSKKNVLAIPKCKCTTYFIYGCNLLVKLEIATNLKTNLKLPLNFLGLLFIPAKKALEFHFNCWDSSYQESIFWCLLQPSSGIGIVTTKFVTFLQEFSSDMWDAGAHMAESNVGQYERGSLNNSPWLNP